jgi:hypothetical protein
MSLSMAYASQSALVLLILIGMEINVAVTLDLSITKHHKHATHKIMYPYFVQETASLMVYFVVVFRDFIQSDKERASVVQSDSLGMDSTVLL